MCTTLIQRAAAAAAAIPRVPMSPLLTLAGRRTAKSEPGVPAVLRAVKPARLEPTHGYELTAAPAPRPRLRKVYLRRVAVAAPPPRHREREERQPVALQLAPSGAAVLAGLTRMQASADRAVAEQEASVVLEVRVGRMLVRTMAAAAVAQMVAAALVLRPVAPGARVAQA